MTYGVPYSFVPGTKAKADEVNANFIDVLDKIENTNSRIDEANSQTENSFEQMNSKIEDVEASCANLDLSNLSSTGKSVLDAKANVSLLDGTWVNKAVTLCSAKSISANTTHTFSLSSYLPSDGAKYEILVTIAVDFPSSSSSQAAIYMKSDFITSTVPLVRYRSGQNVPTFACASAVTISSSGRKLTVNNTEFGVNTPTYTLRAIGYRKVR